MIIYTIISYIAISAHMTMIKEFGGIATVIIGNARKSMTIILSFILFPKPGSVFYIIGGILVFGGLTLNAYSKEMGWGKEELKPIPTTPTNTKNNYVQLSTTEDNERDDENNDRESGSGNGNSNSNGDIMMIQKHSSSNSSSSLH